jgi:hypothetical protein
MQDGVRILTSQDLNVNSTTKQEQTGAIGQTDDGRLYRYVGFGYVSGTTTFNPGLFMVGPTAPSNSTGLAITASGTGGQVAANLAANSTTLVVTNGSTAVWVDEFAGGWLQIIVSAGGTYNLRIKGNSIAAASTGYITLTLKEPIPANATTLIPGTDTVNLRLSPYSYVIPSLTEGKVYGVTQTPSTAATAALSSTSSPGSYGWIQVEGPAFVGATSGTLGYPVGQDTSGTAGFAINKASGTTTEELGTFITAEASSTAYVNLHIV